MKRRPRRHGSATVEFAVVLPFLVLLLLGIWEVGRLVQTQQLLVNAAREAGRQASTGQKSDVAVKQVVIDYLTRAGINTTGAQVTLANLTGSSADPRLANQMDRYRVTVSLPFSNVRWIALDQLTDRETLSASSDWYSMRDLPLTVSATIPIE